MHIKSFNILLITFLTIISSLAQKKADPLAAKIAAFDDYVESARKEWQVPGLAVAVIKDGKIILSKGYGGRRLGEKTVDTKTLFSIGSTTKAMTAACMGMLVDEGKVKWDDPVLKHLPDFRLYDPYVTKELKIRDLFTHNNGVGNTDFLWSMMNIPADEIIKKMAEVEPSYSLRSSFIYQNIFYLMAGKVIEKVSGSSWKEFITTRIFSPLGMSRTQAYLKDVKDPNQTSAYYFVHGAMMEIEQLSADAVGPAGSVWSSIEDMAQWTLCMLDSSKYAGGRLLKPATWAEMFKPQVVVPASQFYPTMQLIKPNWTTYGLGWFQHDYKGRKVNFHTGSLPGAIAMHGQMPEEKIGFYFLGNYDHAEVRHALMYKAFDLFSLGGTRDWSAEFKKLYAGIRDRGAKAEKEFEAHRTTGTSPSLPLASFAGKYSAQMFGEAEVKVEGSDLVVSVNGVLKAKLSHWHYNTFRGEYEKVWYGKATAVFNLSAEGVIKEIEFDGLTFKK